MHKRYFLKLVRKHLKGKATAEEEQLLISYYSLFESEPDVIALFSNEERQELKNQMNYVIRQRIAAHNRLNNNIRFIKKWYTQAAAAVILAGIISCTFFLLHSNAKKQVLSAKISQANQNRFIHLPDGSMVVVMKDSKLTFSPEFNKAGKREVYLDGQAFFDVKHNALKPFVVHTGKLIVTVLGTAFNIRAIKGDNKIIVTVTRGKVSVANKHKLLGTITPNQQIIFNKVKANAIKKVVKADTCIFWKEQDLLFDDVTMAEAANLLKDRFKVNILFTDPKLMLNRFTSTFQHNETLEHELELICDFNNAVYTYDKAHATVTISDKPIKL